MANLKKIMASDVGVRPYQIKGYENLGLLYTISYDAIACGAQCGYCYQILWFNNREMSVLKEKKPDSIPNSGPEYTAYYHNKLKRFMNSLPPCPVCGQRAYDLFVNNRTLVRFEDGTPWPEHEKDEVIIDVDPKTIKIWWYEE